MTMEILRSFLLWCMIINYGILALWALLMMTPHEWMYRIWSRWYRISIEQFDAIQLLGILVYKTLIIVFNMVPFIALTIVR